MPHASAVISSCARLIALFLLCAGAALATDTNGSPPPARFSHTLSTSERAQLKLERLTSDQLAVLDALVRRDVAARSSRAADAPATFSGRLTDDERRNAGVTVLDAKEIAKLDDWVDRYTAAGIARTLLSAPLAIARHRQMEPREDKPERKIHGTLSLSMGWGSGGYSERTGSMVLRMDDPAGRYSISVGISESHIKGGDGYVRYRDDPFYLRPGLEEP